MPAPLSFAHRQRLFGLWQQGQEAMRQGQPKRAIGFYEQSLAADPAFTRCDSTLLLAMESLRNGNRYAGDTAPWTRKN